MSDSAFPKTGQARRRTRAFERLQALRRLGYQSYSDYLRSPHWQAVRRRFAESDREQACFCGEDEGIQLHHKTYARIGRERLSDLEPLCRRCHALVHVLEERGDISLDLKGLIDPARVGEYSAAQAQVKLEEWIAEREAYLAHWRARYAERRTPEYKAAQKAKHIVTRAEKRRRRERIRNGLPPE